MKVTYKDKKQGWFRHISTAVLEFHYNVQKNNNLPTKCIIQVTFVQKLLTFEEVF